MGTDLKELEDGSLVLRFEGCLSGEEMLRTMLRVRALLDVARRSIACDLRGLTTFEESAASFARSVLMGARDRIVEIVFVGGGHDAKWAAGAGAAFIGVPFAFRESLPAWVVAASPAREASP